MDLLISTLKLERVAVLQEAAILPCVGNDAFAGEKGIMSSELEVYGGEADRFALVQQRAPAATGRQEQYAASLALFLQETVQAQEVRTTTAPVCPALQSGCLKLKRRLVPVSFQHCCFAGSHPGKPRCCYEAGQVPGRPTSSFSHK